ncbi:proprotein convertase P-domain-containing protein [Streptomyces sp. NPDC004667]|uniref:proprotein convertase P-domain-containing protein n=1 Tax=Streptomyces sp. NPDC004667 TaxID=3154285 RepID=UPI0033B23CED
MVVPVRRTPAHGNGLRPSPTRLPGRRAERATTGSLTDVGPGSPDRLLYVGTAAQRPRGPRFADTTGFPIADLETVLSPVTVAGVPGKARADLDVEIGIEHADSGDLRIDVIAPDGAVIPVKDEWEGWGVPDVHVVYAVDASAHTANGVWRLRVFDARAGHTGRLDSFALRF